MIQQWKQRLYAFLLRRVLGPYLDPTSLQRLDDTVEVSFSDGTFVLRNVVLDCEYLSNKIQHQQQQQEDDEANNNDDNGGIPGLKVRKARIDKLEIHLTLRENTTTTTTTDNTDGSTTTTSGELSSLAWRAFKLGTSTTSTSTTTMDNNNNVNNNNNQTNPATSSSYSSSVFLPAVSLIAEIILDGIFIELEPIPYHQRQRKRKRQRRTSQMVSTTRPTDHNSSSSSSSKSIVSNYVDSVMKSLQLQLHVNGIEIKLLQQHHQDHHQDHQQQQSWISLRLSSFVYRDLNNSMPSSSSSTLTTNGNHAMAQSMILSHNNKNSSSSRDNTNNVTIISNKSIEISDILVQIGQDQQPTRIEGTSEREASSTSSTNQLSSSSSLAFIQGRGRVLYRVIQSNIEEDSRNKEQDKTNPSTTDPTTKNNRTTTTKKMATDTNSDQLLQPYQDVDIVLNHQVNVSVNAVTLNQCLTILDGFSDITKFNTSVDEMDENGNNTNTNSHNMVIEKHDDEEVEHDLSGRLETTTTSSSSSSVHIRSLRDNPHFLDDSDVDGEDLRVLTGIMSQYREAYYLAENNQLRGGILVPTNAYLDDAQMAIEDNGDIDGTFDVFFDANDHSVHDSDVQTKECTNETNNNDDSEQEKSDQIRLKARFHLNSCCFKVVFRDPTLNGNTSAIRRTDEYVLISISDVDVGLAKTDRKSEIDFSILNFEIEDALQKSPIQLSNGNSNARMLENGVEIGTVFCFRHDTTQQRMEGDDELVVTQPPCVHIDFKKEQQTNATEWESTCNISLLPFEFTFRQRMADNMTAFNTHLQSTRKTDREQISSVADDNADDTPMSDKSAAGRLLCSVRCPSVTFLMPFTGNDSTPDLFHRSHTIPNNIVVNENALGITLEMISFKLDSNVTEDDCTDGDAVTVMAAEVECNNVFFFAVGTVNEHRSGVGSFGKLQRKDFFVIAGRDEVIPRIPVSVKYTKLMVGTSLGVRTRDSFPVACSISSFKARQEDDDTDTESDSAESPVSSKGSAGMDDLSRKEIQYTDPQASMLLDVEKSKSILSVTIPQILMDIAKDEVESLVNVMVSLTKNSSRLKTPEPTNGTIAKQGLRPVDTPSVSQPNDSFSVSIRCEDVLLCLREVFHGVKSDESAFALQVAMEKLHCHALLRGAKLKHCRTKIHDLCLYAAQGLQSDTLPRSLSSSRVEMVRSSVLQIGRSSLTPFLYRSHLFIPISQESPSILIDFIDNSVETNFSKHDIKKFSIHLSLYHLTGRLRVDSNWIDRLGDIIPKTTKSESTSDLDQHHDVSMTKVFVTTADINVDYTTPRYFSTPARSIVRVGDCRLSCSMLTPAGSVQAFSVSVGDVNCDIGHLMSHNEENMSLCGAFLIMRQHSTHGQLRRQSESSTVFGSMPEAVLRELGFANILSLDTLSAAITIRKQVGEGGSQTRTSEIALVMGTLSIQACKDSFACFAACVGELQTKLTALNDEEVKSLRRQQPGNETPLQSSGSLVPFHLSAQDLPYHEESGLKPQSSTKEGSYLLDGYAWTSIDQDLTLEPQIDIPSSDDHAEYWYGSAYGDKNGTDGGIPADIFPNHFSVNPIADPMAEGDMGVQTYAGKTATISLKSRLLVRKMNISLRLFDGYEWPEMCTRAEQDAASRQGLSFVIEPLAPASKEGAGQTSSGSSNEDKARQEAIARRARLMGDLTENTGPPGTFVDTPLPRDRATTLKDKAVLRICAKRPNTFLQLSFQGLSCRVDSYNECPSHRLQSIVELSISKLSIVETLSDSSPHKMLGDWISNTDHPRDTRCGSMMLKLATWSPVEKVSESMDMMGNECEATLQLLPMRCMLDQRVITFARAFFNKKQNENDDQSNASDFNDAKGGNKSWCDGLHLIPPPTFHVFKVKPWKVKVDYNPNKIDIAALREGNVVELVNVSPIRRMVITLSEVNVLDSDAPFNQVVSSWVREIVGTQLHKFLANAQPFEPITDVGQGLTDVVVLPYEAFKNGDSVQRAMSKGVKSLAEAVAFQTLSQAGSFSRYAADLLTSVLKRNFTTSDGGRSLLQMTNYRIVVVPYRQYIRNGVTGAMTSFVSGLPVLLVAPLTGVTEAASYTLLEARNSIRPGLMIEEEASMNMN